MLTLLLTTASAATFTASNPGQLTTALGSAQSQAGEHTINLTGSFTTSFDVDGSQPWTRITIRSQGTTTRRTLTSNRSGADGLVKFVNGNSGGGKTLVFESVDLNGSGNGRILYAAAGGNVEFHDVEISNASFAGNLGGAIFLENNANLVATDSTFAWSGGNAASRGGFIATADTGVTSQIVVDGCSFTGGRSSDRGGAIFSRGDLTVRDSQFFDNRAGGGHGGGGIYFDGSTRSLVVEDSNFNGNVGAGRGGGAIYVESAASGTSSIRANTFTSNQSTGNEGGGAIYLRNGTNAPALSENVFDGNTAPSNQGGAVRVHSNAVSVTGGLFCGNSAGTGGAIYTTGGTISRAIFHGNTAGNGGAVYATGSATIERSSFGGNTSTSDQTGSSSRQTGGAFSHSVSIDLAQSHNNSRVVRDASNGTVRGSAFVEGDDDAHNGNAGTPTNLYSRTPPQLGIAGNACSVAAFTPTAAGDLCTAAHAPIGAVDCPPAAIYDCFVDGDGDGYGSATPILGTDVLCNTPGMAPNDDDCDDTDDEINPDADEQCDDVDHDCDGDIKNGLPFFDYWPDLDGDTWGAGTPVFDCEPPTGYADRAGDCVDSDEDINPGANEVCNGIDDNCSGAADEGLPTVQYYVDGDGDGYGSALSLNVCAALQPANTSSVGGDCNDSNPAIFPGATEVCNNLDDDCDGSVDEGLTFVNYWTDADGDTYGTGSPLSSCVVIPGRATRAGDCDDTNPNINPSRPELCNGIDDNCNGQIDDGLPFTTYYRDLDGDTYGSAASGTESTCDGPSAGYVATNTDCDDANPAIRPGATEVCNNLDDDCDGQVDEGLTFVNYWTDADSDSWGTGSPQSSCVVIPGRATRSGDCDDTNPAVNPDADERCNGIDDDCDGQIDIDAIDAIQAWRDVDGDGFGNPAVNQEFCFVVPNGWVQNTGDCNDQQALAWTGADEVCDGVDNDCDGTIDVLAVDASNWWPDADGDGFGADGSAPLWRCSQPAGHADNDDDCDDGRNSVFPGAPEQCNDRDDDCDGVVDEDITFRTYYLDLDGDNYGIDDALTNVFECQAPADYGLFPGDCDDADPAVYPGAVETCDGVDNNCSGDELDAVDLVRLYEDLDQDNWGVVDGPAIFDCFPFPGAAELPGDCDDTDPGTNPDATELCDLIDNDCNGVVDDNVTDADLTWLDLDGDGYGDPATVALYCDYDRPAERILQGGDCDDTEPLAWTGADEVCDGVDNDCDGLTDDDDPDLIASTWYLDTDGDGFGSTISVIACEQPDGYVANSDDCDDADDAVRTFFWYEDADGDGLGDPLTETESCFQPTGLVGNSDDCDDDDATVGAARPWYPDADGDEWGVDDGDEPVVSCVGPPGTTDRIGDCDDTQSNVHPDATDPCNDCDDATECIVEERRSGCRCDSGLGTGPWLLAFAALAWRRRRAA